MRNLIIFLLSTLLSTATLFAGDGVWVKSIPVTNIGVGGMYHIMDRSHSLEDLRVSEGYEGFVFLNYTRKAQSDLDLTQKPWHVTLTYEYMTSSSSTPLSNSLTIRYENGQYIYSDYGKVETNSAIENGYEIKVTGFTGEYHDGTGWIEVSNPQSSSFIPDDIELKLELRSSRYYQLTKNGTDTDLSDLYFSVEPDQYHLRWEYMQGAEEYDLEWVFIDKHSLEYTTLANSSTVTVGESTDPFVLKEPSRVRVWGTQYFLDKTFPEGTLYFRIRAVSVFVESGLASDDIRVGDWNYCQSSSFMGTTIDKVKLVDREITPSQSYEANKNWMYGVAYAEAGKSVSSVSFYDGMNRGRQSMTYNTSDKVTLISESKFDYEGRQVVSVIPAPVHGRKLGYHANFNLVSSNNTFDEADFDINITDYQAATIQPSPLYSPDQVTGDGGAAQYFSANNNFEEDDLFRSAIPDAQGYVYSQTIYRNDGTGRIERVGGIGEKFKATGEHAVQTFYGSPTEFELRRLFGNNVASGDDFQGYRKDMVKDANGQLSVTYYDKRGHVIATALAGDAPANLIEVEGAIEEEVTTPLNNNNSSPNDFTKVSQHTFMNQVEDNLVTFNYNLTGTINQIITEPVQIGFQTLDFGDFCSTCRYNLTIEIKKSNGTPVHLYTQAIDPVGACENGALAVLEPVNWSVTFDEIGEYRIIKTLSVNLEDMQVALEANLDNYNATHQQEFVDTYLDNVDFTGCYTTCDEYCAAYVKYEYEHEKDPNTGMLLHGLGSFDLLSQTTKDGMINACLTESCDPSELNDDFSNENNTEPTPTLCSTYFDLMIKQISPGGVFYDDHSSSFWTDMGAGPFTINGEGYTLAQLQTADIYTRDMAIALISYHREFCHFSNCDLRSQSDAYSTNLTNLVLNPNTTWNASSSVFTSPQSQTFSSTVTADPFVGSVYDVAPTLADRITNYLTDEQTEHYNAPATQGTYIACNISSSSPAYAQTGSLFDYVNASVACMVANTTPTPTADEILQMKKNMFLGIYNNIKQEMIRHYDEEVRNPACPSFTDDNAIFPGVRTQEEIEAEIQSMVYAVNSANCGQSAYNNTVNWISQISTSCLEALGNANLYVSNFTEVNLQAGSIYAGDIQQLFYDYSLNSCPENTWNWFYNPGTGTNNGSTEYNQIIAMLQTNCLSDLPLSFEVSPAPTQYTLYPPVVPATEAEITSAMQQLINYTFTQSNAWWPSTTPASATSHTVTVSGYQIPNSNFVGSAVLSISYDPSFIDNNKWHTNYTFTIVGYGCSYQIWDQNMTQSTPSRVEDISIVDYVTVEKDPSDIHWVQNSNDQYGFYINLLIGAPSPWPVFIGSPNDCQPQIGTFSDLGGVIIPIPNFTEDCIENQMAQATIDAELMYNNNVEDVMNIFVQSSTNCLDVREDFTMTYTLKEYQYTLYYYDLAGNLIQTVPPQGVKILSQIEVDGLTPTSTLPNHKMETRYEYNGLNSLIGQYTPDGGRSTFYLDKLYRVRYSQNARQASPTEHKASYSTYDPLGRVVEAGEILLPMSDPNAMAAYLQDLADGVAVSQQPLRLDYTKTTYEDVYENDPSIASIFNDGEQLNLRNAIGAIEHHQADYSSTGSMIPGSEMVTVSSYSYDPHKNVKQIVNSNYALQTDYSTQKHKTVEYEYDLISGNVNKVHYQKGERDEFNHMYHYDANNRLIRAFTSQNEDVWEMDAKYFYYLHGALARRELGENKVQGTDYAYNLQGWLKGVNSTTLDQNRDLGKDGVSASSTSNGDNQFFGVDAFGFNLNYFAGDYTPIGENFTPPYFTPQNNPFANTDDLRTANGNHGNLYNGNITHMVTAIRNLEENVIPILGNIYKYDQLQRIKSMDVYSADPSADPNVVIPDQPSTWNTNLFANNGFLGADLYRTGAYKETYSYDKNGNIKTLTRNGYGVQTAGSAVANLEMDNFKYHYATSSSDVTETLNPNNSNRLMRVEDDANLNDHYSTDIDGYVAGTDVGQNTGNYEYDASGQLIKDLDEGIDKIEWTVTGKVKRITFAPSTGKHGLLFVYDPMDMRVAKIVYNNDAHTEYSATYYVHDAQGNPMATYTTQNFNQANGDDIKDKLYLSERYIYGSSRLGLEQVDKLMAFKQSDLTELDLGNPVVLNYSGPAGTWFKSDNTHGNFTNYVVFTPGDYNTDGKSDLKISHDNSSTTFGAHVWSQLDAGKSATLEWDMLTSTSKIIVLYALNDAGTILTETWCNNAGHYSTTINVPTNSTGRTRFKFYTINQSTALDYTVANFKVTGATNPWGKELAPVLPVEQEELIVGDKRYELSNHLGNVLAVVTDRKIPLTIGANTVYSADVLTYCDYTPFGVEMDNRHGEEATGRYRYGFQGQEHDDEIKGNGNSVNYKYRMHDPRIGRFFAIDPLAGKYPKWTPYSFSGNQVIVTTELEGLEPEVDGTENGEVQAATHKEKGDWRMWQWQPLNGEPDAKYDWADISATNPFKMVDGTTLNLPKDAQVMEITLKTFEPVYENGVVVGKKPDQYRVVKFKIGNSIYHQEYTYTGRNMNRTPDYNGIWDGSGNKFSNNLTQDGKYAGDIFCTNHQTLVSDKVCLNTKLSDEAWAAYIREARNNVFSDLFLDWVIKKGGGGDYSPQGPIDFWSSHDNFIDKQVKLALMLAGPGSYAYIKEGLMEFDNDYGKHYRVYFFQGYNSKTNQPIFAPVEHKTIQMVNK